MRIGILGAGFSGTALALQLMARRPAPEVLLFEPGPPGPGLAYGTREPEHLLNVPAAGMSLFPDRPGDFSEWLAARRPEIRTEDGPVFAPRALYGAYLRQALTAALDDPAGRLRHHSEAVAEVMPGEKGGFRLRGASGLEERVDRLVLALGGFASGGGAPPHVHGNPWDPAALEGLAPDAPVLLLGTGLTMADMVLALRARGHEGVVTAVSRHGWPPLSHVAGAFPSPWPVRLPAGAGVLEVMRLLRRDVRRAAAAGQPWQAVIDGLRPQVQALWQGWDAGERARFLRHARSVWNLHRHRLAPAVARRLAEEERRGRLRFEAARLEGWQVEGGEVVARLRRRGGEGVSRRAARIILCTGPEGSHAWREAAPFPALLSQGLARLDPLGAGLAVRRDGAVLGVSGQPVPGLFAMGPLTRGALWEVTAVPEIRAQALALAGHLAS
ncbi:FAD/NAD(P)-binding protein [Teichococcus aerofrigidensis]